VSAVLPEIDLPGDVGAEIEARARVEQAFKSPAVVPLTPAQRLTLSRERLRAVMFPVPSPPPASAGRIEAWLASLKSLPGIDIVVDAAQAWWHRHPLRPVCDMAGQASRSTIRPVAQRHPFALVLAAAAAGMLIASVRPWRWALRSVLFAGFLPQVLSRVVAKLPVESWLTMLNSALATRSPAAAAAASRHPADPPPRA
jgi:hypothetical protein